MRGIPLLLTIAVVLSIGGLVFILGTQDRKLEGEMIAKIENSPQYRDATQKVEKIRADVEEAVRKAGAELEALARALEAKSRPEIEAARGEINKLIDAIARELRVLQVELAAFADALERDLVRLGDDGRREAVQAFETAKVEAEKLEAELVEVAGEVKAAVQVEGARAADELQKQKGNLQKQLEKVEDLGTRFRSEEPAPEKGEEF